jgi:L-seryl-tRNA(Ser) seleniumtransferase
MARQLASTRRKVPSVDALLRSDAGRRAAADFGRPVIRWAVREVLAAARTDADRGVPPAEDDVLLARAAGLAARTSYGLTRVINATGVVLHTGLGRAPLPLPAARAAARAGHGYADLEVDRETGRRGKRTARAERLLVALSGAEAAFVVNNNAAAVLLVLASLARRKEVLVSRGELIEIGGEFRLPDIMAASGAKLVEVGTTNRTRAADYRSAVTPRTALILRVHPSNYRITGFATSPSTTALTEVASRSGIPFVYDLGSGLLERFPGIPAEEPSASDALADGADLVTFSGDKLLGGPQAGIVLGRTDLVERLRRNPLARALRCDKMQIAALESVLRIYATEGRNGVPVWRMLDSPASELRTRARTLATDFPGAEPLASEAVVGGGSVPGYAIPSWAVRLPSPSPERLAARLRTGTPSVFCRVDGDAVLFDLRTVDPVDDDRLARAVRYALEQR